MDLLFKRYANPFSLLDGYIQTSRFCEFLSEFGQLKKEDDRWEFFLHKVYDKTFDEFCEVLQNTQDLQGMSDDDIEATVQESMKILGNFNPDLKVGEV